MKRIFNVFAILFAALSVVASEEVLVVTDVVVSNRNISIDVSCPKGFTNSLEIYSCDDLWKANWEIVATNISADGTAIHDWSGVMTNKSKMRFYVIGNPSVDTDEDKLPDAREKYLYKTNPNQRDTDGDELTDYFEINQLKTVPTDRDSDRDGMADGWEYDHDFDPNDGSDAYEDEDGDGWSNLEEHLRGGDPSVPVVPDTNNILGLKVITPLRPIR